jgi:hypothetical protein
LRFLNNFDLCDCGLLLPMVLLIHLSCHQAEFVPVPDPSLTEQYEYANEHDIKCLVIITDASFSLADTVKVRYVL